ncbi:hypothetical protein RRG08_018497 [Elysia crispata]|uniref:Uncharacterized protein n=1 Tax=Elysia crispata TaxID=231223 RepID=A0AAE1CRI2_9GAST|nr:hypothetical protein RRG08_018497 [Elysia crispata]
MTSSGTSAAAAAPPVAPAPGQPLSPGSGAAAMPREQLKIMAAEMNTILTKLMGAMNVGAEERHRLRQELAEAQERLSALKELQRQMTEAGVVPPDRIPLESSSLEDEDADIPRALVMSTADPSTTTQLNAGAAPGNSSKELEELQPTSETALKSSTSSSPPASPMPSLEASIEPVAAAVTAVPPPPPLGSNPEQQEQQQDTQEVDGGLVHHGIQETTQLEESVEALAPTSTPTNVVGAVEVSMKEDEDDEDDDDNNEVSVKDLPLPDVNLPVGTVEEEEEEQGVVAGSRPSSSLLDVVDLDDSDSETEGGSSTVGGGSLLASTIEDPAGEEEGEEEYVDAEDEDALLRKITASSLLSSSLLSSALASPSDVDTEIITVAGEEGNNNKDDVGSSNVDNSAGDTDQHGSSSVDRDTTSPIEI